MAEITLVAQTGRGTGSGPAKRMRAEGRIPAVVYGLGTDARPISVEWRALRAALTTDAGLNALISLEVDGETSLTIVKDMQRHPVRRNVLHVDFLRIDADQPIEVEVPIVLEGEATAVIDEQGMVEHVLTALHVRVKPSAIPNELTVDVSEMEIGSVITIGDIALPPGVTTDMEPDRPVVTAAITRLALAEEEEGAEGEEGEEGEGAEGEGEAGEGEARAGDGGRESGDAGEAGSDES
jgi:large subunit ribosomal protein L25